MRATASTSRSPARYQQVSEIFAHVCCFMIAEGVMPASHFSHSYESFEDFGFIVRTN